MGGIDWSAVDYFVPMLYGADGQLSDPHWPEYAHYWMNGAGVPSVLQGVTILPYQCRRFFGACPQVVVIRLNSLVEEAALNGITAQAYIHHLLCRSSCLQVQLRYCEGLHRYCAGLAQCFPPAVQV